MESHWWRGRENTSTKKTAKVVESYVQNATAKMKSFSATTTGGGTVRHYQKLIKRMVGGRGEKVTDVMRDHRENVLGDLFIFSCGIGVGGSRRGKQWQRHILAAVIRTWYERSGLGIAAIRSVGKCTKQ
jgi:hypothetical protein